MGTDMQHTWDGRKVSTGLWQRNLTGRAHTWRLRFEPGPLLLAFMLGQFAKGHAFLRVFLFYTINTIPSMIHTHPFNTEDAYS